MTKDKALRMALDKKAENARELGLDYEPENTLHWHALNYRTAPTHNAQAMFEALEKFFEAAIKEALNREAMDSSPNGEAQPEQEPVAYIKAAELEELKHCNGMSLWAENAAVHTDDSISKQLLPSGHVPVYTTPPPAAEAHKRKPLTDEQIIILANSQGWNVQVADLPANLLRMRVRDLGRAIEAAHGITASEAEDSARSKT